MLPIMTRKSVRRSACIVACSAALVLGCDREPTAAPVLRDPVRPDASAPDGGGARICVRPAEHCACEEGSGPIECYDDLIEVLGDALVCRAGERYCRDGAWTACEAIREYTIDRGPARLVTGPDPCSPCDPRCFVSRDVPGPADLVPSRSSPGLRYDPDRGGLELAPRTAPAGALPDLDRDGVPDIADECPGPGWFRSADGACATDPALYHTLPYGSSAIDPLDVSTQIRTADVYFLMDTTGSMGGELARLRADLTTGSFAPGCGDGIIGAIRCTIPDAWFGVGYHDDYPFRPYGGAGIDDVYRNVLDIQASVPAAQAAVNTLAIHWGSDGPESQTQALWAIATGNSIESYLPARAGCTAGRWGYPCFRAGTIPIVVLITDAPFHNGPGDANPYCLGCSSTALPLPAPTPVAGNERMDASAYPGGGAAIDITSAWVGFGGRTSSMTDEVTFGCGSGSRDAVFRVRLSSTQSVRFTLEGSTYDTVLGVFPVAGGSGWCNDDSIGVQSRLDLTLGPGEYWVIVDGYRAASGAYRLSMGRGTSSSGFTGIRWPDAIRALSSAGVRTITVQTCGAWSDPYCQEGERHARDLGNATGSIGSSGAPYVMRANADGSGLSATIVDAIVDLASYSRMDIAARVVGDERGFTRTPITAVGWGPGSCTGISGGTTLLQCLPGTSVRFSIDFRNDVVMPATSPQVFTFFIEIVGDGTIVLTRVPVRIVVPAIATTYPPSAAYWRDYDSTLRCDPLTEAPDWQTLSWVAPSIPPGTRIEFELRSASSAAGLDSAPLVTVPVPGSSSPIDLASVLVSAGYPEGLPHLRVRAVLYSSPSRTETPTLGSFEVAYRCLPAS